MMIPRITTIATRMTWGSIRGDAGAGGSIEADEFI
jgi:hypothetical protein